MLRKALFLTLTASGAGTFSGCQKAEEICILPAPCYSGVVLRARCFDGLLIQVDRPYAIGLPLPGTWTDSLGTDNVIAAVNSLGALAVRGQRVYFTYINDPTHQTPPNACPTYEAAEPLPVPHLVLSNVSATPCAQSQPHQ